MSFTVKEKSFARRASTGKNAGAEVVYIVYGVGSEADAKAALQSFAPAMYDDTPTLFFNAITNFELVAEDTHLGSVWQGTVTYGGLSRITREAGQSTYSFSTSGGTQHITSSIATKAPYVASGITAPTINNVIGQTKDSVEGCDIVVPVFECEETHVFEEAEVTTAYKGQLFRLTGTVNDAPFREFDQGEGLFMGCAGQARGDGKWEITFRFAGSPNRMGSDALTIGEITGIEKRGWQYLEVQFDDQVSSNRLVKRPVIVLVHQVYRDGDWSGLGIGT